MIRSNEIEMSSRTTTAGEQSRPHGRRLCAWVATPIVAICAMACASAPPPTARMASTQAAVRAAKEVGAERVPQADLHLKLAEEQVGKAKQMIDYGENERADFLLQRANADAELGLAMAREDVTRSQANRVIEQTRTIIRGNQ